MSGLLADDLHRGGRTQINLVKQEAVGVMCLQPERAESCRREVRQVRCDDGIRAATDSCRDDMTVVLVGQPDTRLKYLPARDQRASPKASRMLVKRLATSIPG
jgi:hypothetical protein